MKQELERSLRKTRNLFEPIRLRIASLAAAKENAKFPALMAQLGKLSDWANVFARELDEASALAKKLNRH